MALPGTAVLLWFLVAGPPLVPAERYVGEMSVTYYWVALEGESRPSERTVALRDPEGRILARVTPGFRRALDREGTGQLQDGRLLNVATRVGGAWRYQVRRAPCGAAGRELVPYVSVAVDPRRIPLGSCLRIPAFESMTLPGGAGHDGGFYADDVGGAIRGARIDVYIALEEHLRHFETVVPSHATTAVFVVEEGS